MSNFKKGVENDYLLAEEQARRYISRYLKLKSVANKSSIKDVNSLLCIVPDEDPNRANNEKDYNLIKIERPLEARIVREEQVFSLAEYLATHAKAIIMRKPREKKIEVIIPQAHTVLRYALIRTNRKERYRLEKVGEMIDGGKVPIFYSKNVFPYNDECLTDTSGPKNDSIIGEPLRLCNRFGKTLEIRVSSYK
jgi:hypothetical protein